MQNNQEDNFFQDDNYSVPVTSNYMKFQEGDNVFRALSSAITGYEYFNKENKPVRSREMPESAPNIKDGGAVKHFWAFAVWNYAAKKVQILEITQSTIMNAMTVYIKNPKWGSPKKYDFIVSKTGSNMTTEYAISVNPAEEIEPSIMEQYEKTKINLEALYEGNDPFMVK
jgi:hypothetical protein